MTPVRLSRFLLCPVCWALLVLASATVDAAAEPLGHLLLKRAALIAISPKGQATPGWRPLVASPSPAVKVQPNGHRGPALVDGTRGPAPPPPAPSSCCLLSYDHAAAETCPCCRPRRPNEDG